MVGQYVRIPTPSSKLSPSALSHISSLRLFPRLRSPGDALCPGALSDGQRPSPGSERHRRTSERQELMPSDSVLAPPQVNIASNTDGLCTISYIPVRKSFDPAGPPPPHFIAGRAIDLRLRLACNPGPGPAHRFPDRLLIPDRRSGGDSGGGRGKEGKRPGGVHVYDAHAQGRTRINNARSFLYDTALARFTSFLFPRQTRASADHVRRRRRRRKRIHRGSALRGCPRRSCCCNPMTWGTL